MHYIQSLAEEASIPVVGQTFLSPQIAESSVQTRRDQAFHWQPYRTADPREWGMEGLSYEGFQPPLYYALLAPFYAALPGDMLFKLYGLRLVSVLLSLITVAAAFYTTRELFAGSPILPGLACLFLILLPERAVATSRVNNDVLLEALAAVFILAFTRAMLRGLTVRRAQALGLLFGLGLLAKLWFVWLAGCLIILFWMRRRESGWWKCAAWAASDRRLVIGPWVARNLQLYGDFTGFAGYANLKLIQAVDLQPPLRLDRLASAVIDLFRHFWLVWWKGGGASSNWLVDGLALVLSIIGAAGIVSLVRTTADRARRAVILSYLLVIALYGAAIVWGYFAGRVPVIQPEIQGRYLLPVMVPVAILFTAGLFLNPRLRWAGVAALGLLALLDFLLLFGNLLPFHYFWSAVASHALAQPVKSLGLPEIWAVFLPRFVGDKPVALQPILPVLPALYIAAAAIVVADLLVVERGAWSVERQLSDPE